MKQEQIDKLRKGYTTGAAATAGAAVAYLVLNNRYSGGAVSLLLPTGKTLNIPVAKTEKFADAIMVSIIKDAGDDPDVTDKMTIKVRLKYSAATAVKPEDYLEICGKGWLVIKGGDGVGLVTRPGLDATVGKWAINRSPRRMLVDNLKRVGFGSEVQYLTIEITAVNGAGIARKTLNPMLGIIGGISILGTTGIVVPYSNAAYIKTIEIRVRCAAAEGVKHIAFTTGSRTRTAILQELSDIGDDSCIRIGDFIADSLKAVAATKLKTVSVACMPGKLYKYACGHEYTHAHKVSLKPELMVEELKLLGVDSSGLKKIAKCNTVGEAAAMLERKIYLLLLERLADRAFNYLAQWSGKVKVKLYVYDIEGKILVKR
ncbi:MAG: cobalt-precorrin-5B (C(1))-methyltransferase CbiD [Victivallaceae bacterium]|nr:cobalt-precorrin-5B (C(1))-methyltransferase CbiD [Victivallaceae bacterium]